jgi:flagellar biosynthesis protein FliQ
MSAVDLVEFARQAAVSGLVAVAPALTVGLVVGLVVGFVQAATGIHEQIIGLVPRLAAMAVVVILTLPWLVERFAELLRLSAGVP